MRPDEVPDDVRFAAIWSNPPIRVGKDALHAMLLQLARRGCAPGGEAHLVVGKNLGADSLQRWIADRARRRRRPDREREGVPRPGVAVRDR